MMRILLAAATTMLLAGTAMAQDHVQRYGEPDHEKTAVEKTAEKDANQAYKKSLGNIPDKGPTDPWGAVRTTDTPKPAATATKPKKTKTGSADSKQ
jgi:opacity protein-like surface antigen